MPQLSHREVVDKFYQLANARDWDAIEPLLDPDYTFEMPQSGERVRGLKKNREMNENYPGLPQGEPVRVTGSADRWVTTPTFSVLKVAGTGDDYIVESRVKYPDGSLWYSVDMFHFRAGRIVRQTAYYAPSLEPAEWRSRWVERF
jgi:ketosteroid isomerase-like protein